ncbi:peptidase S41 [Pseudoalteromonas ruthenica]|uniref:S41 family peptidase n=1 Tax=Pseudoalteromonas ruthenica TaxID=151081 RepID=UPI001107CF7B|nr:S41 family peptidase [Pseudoalteromonas ruthenica]TLX50821.1 peptidase S41 [Pseudoalteromonas ruthenica]
MKKLAFLLSFFPLISTASDYSCEQEFNWLKKTFENNDAGFQYALSQKGERNYLEHNKASLKAIKNADDISDCHQRLQQWLLFFREGHIGLSLNVKKENNASVHNFNKTEFQQHLNNKSKEGIEGIWRLPSYTVGLKKEGSDYNGYVIESANSKWQPGQLKLILNEENDGTYKAIYYMADHSIRHVDSVGFIDQNHLSLGNNWLTLSRQNPKEESKAEVLQYVQLMESKTPLVQQLSKETALLRIPSFSYTDKKHIDTVIRDNLETILSTENLIIDIRGNGGGSDISYEEILPIIYTNPIRNVGVEFLSTPLNNSRMLKFIDDENFSDDDKKWAKEGYKTLQQRPGQFVNLDAQSVSVKKLENVNPLPKKVGILIDESNGSTAEQFLLAAKQSYKVKLLGAPTRGVLDISNMHQVDSPSKNLTLHYSLSKSLRIPEMTIDGKGIQPDFYLDSSIPAYQWVSYTRGMLEEM